MITHLTPHLALIDWAAVARVLLAVTGVLLGRRFTPRGEEPLTTAQRGWTTVILTVLGGLWAYERPSSPVTTWVIAVGLGYAGFALIELARSEVLDIAKTFVARLRGLLKLGEKQ